MIHQREKLEQAAIVDLLRSIGGKVYVLGTKRPRGDHPGTCQTPGLPDLYAFLPAPPLALPALRRRTALWIEAKAAGGRATDAQRAFAIECHASHVAHVLGGVDEVIHWLIEQGYLKREGSERS